MKRVNMLIVALCLVAVAASCSPRQMAIKEAVGMLDTGITSFEQDTDLEMLEAAFPANIKLCEALLANDPENRQLRVLLSRMYASYAWAFLEGNYEALSLAPEPAPDQEAEMAALRYRLSRYYLKGAGYAEKALKQTAAGPCMAAAGIAELDACFSQIGEAAVPELFWYAFNLGTWVNQNRDAPDAFSFSQRARAAMSRVQILDPLYFHGGALFFFMGYHAAIPEDLGGRPGEVLGFYRQLKQLKGDDFLLADLYYARFYLVNQGDREGFEKTLQAVIARHLPEDDPYPLLNVMARQRARIYLNGADLFFPR
ncbi:MAG: TRAP transporter TatT component family protein [Pseudomonadota bacterium]